MIASDIKIGGVYQVNFFGANFPIGKTNATDSFRKRFPNWNDVSGAQVRVLGKGAPPKTRGFKFEVIPAPMSNSTNPDGEWCLATPNYFSPVPAGTAPLTVVKPQDVCNCNIWARGCTCGAMAREKAAKKAQSVNAPPW